MLLFVFFLRICGIAAFARTLSPTLFCIGTANTGVPTLFAFVKVVHDTADDAHENDDDNDVLHITYSEHTLP